MGKARSQGDGLSPLVLPAEVLCPQSGIASNTMDQRAADSSLMQIPSFECMRLPWASVSLYPGGRHRLRFSAVTHCTLHHFSPIRSLASLDILIYISFCLKINYTLSCPGGGCEKAFTNNAIHKHEVSLSVLVSLFAPVILHIAHVQHTGDHQRIMIFLSFK